MTPKPTMSLRESAPDLLRRLIQQDMESADGCEALAARLGEKNPTYNELLRDAAQYRQSVYRFGLVLTALSTPPAGMVLVPREPSEAMMKAADRAVNGSTYEVYPEECQSIWTAMIAATEGE